MHHLHHDSIGVMHMMQGDVDVLVKIYEMREGKMLDVKFNEHGRRIGESHPRAVLSDHEVELLLELLAEREQIVRDMGAGGFLRVAVDMELTRRGLSYRLLALKFEIHKQHVAKIAQGARRCQTPV
jgi:hypothetical protein